MLLQYTESCPVDGGMLERTAACIEPASQLLFRRLEPPVRSHRTLGTSFWGNGGNQLDVPPWWPLYLKRIRASHQNEATLESSVPDSRFSRLAQSVETSRRRRSRASKCDRKSMTSSSATTLRTFAKSSTTAQKANAAHVAEDDISPHVAMSVPSRKTIQDYGDSPLMAGHVGESYRTYISRHTSDMARQLDIVLEEIRQSKSAPGYTGLDRAWTLFKQVSHQQTYATDLFRCLAQSDTEIYHKRALAAFRLMDEESRTRGDYEQAVRLALKMDNYRVALGINERATRRNLQQGCSVFLLLHAVSNQLWNTASRVWNMSFRLTIELRKTNPVRVALVREIGNYRDVPHAVHQLGSRLRERAPVIMQCSGTLQRVFFELLAALVRNGQLMSIITPQALQNLFDISHDLRRAVPSLYLTAIDTINKSALRPDKGSLADAVYNKLRLDLPEYAPDPSTFGSLLSIHAEQESPARTYNRYLEEFAKFHGAADPMSFQKVMSALAAQGDLDGVQQIFLRLSEVHGRPTDPAFYTPLMYAYARLGDVPATLKEFRRMIEAGVKPHSYAWNILVYAHSRSPQPKRAVEVLEMMRTEGVKPDTYTFTTWMSIFARIGDTDAVLDILEQAQQNQVKGSYELVTGLVQSYCLNDQAEAAEKVADAATVAGLQGYPTTMWNYLLRHYAFLADSQGMLRVQQQMSTRSVKADAMTHAAFMTALVVLGKTRDAVQILRTLTLSQTLAATPFHYAILLHGFAQEGDRDMANVIYGEMVERYPRLGASPRLTMLHLQASRNPIENEHPKFAAKYLDEILFELSTEDRASRRPQPGLRRRRGVEAVPSLYMEFFMDLLIKKGQLKRAEQLLDRFETLAQSSYLHLSSYASTSIQFLAARLTLRAEKKEWAEVEATWKQILERGIQIAMRSGPDPEPDAPHTDGGDSQDNIRAISEPLPMQPVGLPGPQLATDKGFTFTSMIQQGDPPESPLDKPGLVILFSQRYLLEVPLNRYLDTLAVRQLQNSATALVAKLESLGFAMTSKNWNRYIQVLARSDDPEHWIIACELFEQKLIMNIPPWPVLQRGKWLPPSESQGETSVSVRRKTIEKRDPGQLMPTYYTAVYLASVLLKANRVAAEGDRSTSVTIWKKAPLTCRYIRRMPFLKDRIQGLLLRGRRLRILPPRRPRFWTEPDRSGVLGSKSPADHVPAEEVLGVREALKQEKAVMKSSTEAAKTHAMRRAELYHGQIPRYRIMKEKRRALESEEQFRRRVSLKGRRILRLLQITRRDLSSPRAVSDMYFGHPAVPISARLVRWPSHTSGSRIYGSEYQRLVKQAQDGKRIRAERSAAIRRLFPHASAHKFLPFTRRSHNRGSSRE